MGREGYLMPRMKLTREAQREVIKVRERQELRAKRIAAAVDKDYEAFDELLSLLDENAPRTVLEWAAAARDLEAGVVSEEARFQVEEKKRPVLVTDAAE